MTDDDDKTVFSPGQRQPAQEERDSTVFIPQPGAQRQAQPTAQVTPTASPLMSTTPQEMISVQRALNPLISAASTLLAVVNKLRNTPQHNDVAGLHRHLVDEIKQFDSKLKQQNTRPEIALSARYQLCAAIDEAVMNTPWGAQAGWAQRSLLSLFHKETAGGEKFFAILQKMMEAPGTNIDLIELNYILLSLGFEGKFRIDPRGRDQLESIRENLYNTVEKLRGQFETDLSPNADSTATSKKGLTQFIPLWVVTAAVFAIILLLFSGFRLWIFQATEPAAEQLQTITQELNKTDQ